ncbi:MAG: hypothetical protein IPO81_08400 [Kouleothrix sp.]|nr:hypothetical protein [Kouleothrix sp.]
MEPETLRGIVRGGLLGDRRFSLATTVLQSHAIDRLSDDFLPDRTILLSDAAIPDEDAAAAIVVRVTGTGVSFPVNGMAVELQFSLVGAEVALRLIATGDSHWNLATGFPPFEHTFAADLLFSPSSPPQIYLCSHQGQDGRGPGMILEGLVDLAATTGGLAALVGRQSQMLAGPVDIGQQGSIFYGIDLDAPPSPSVELEVARVERLSFKVSNYLGYNARRDTYYAIPYIQINAEIPFTAQGTARKIPIEAQMTSLNEDFHFSADLADFGKAALDELKALSGQVGLAAYLPRDGFQIETMVELDRFFFDFNLQYEHKVTLVGIGVRSVNPWTVLHVSSTNKTVQLQNLRLLFTLFDPFGSKSGDMRVDGELAIGDHGVLQLEARYPNWIVQGTLKAGTRLLLKELAELFLDTAPDLPDIEIDELDVMLAPQQYSISAELAGYWPIPIPKLALGIAEVYFFVDYSVGAGISALVRGLFYVGGVDIALSAHYPGSASGWQFAGSTGPGQAIPIGALIDDLAKTFGATTLPGALKDLTIQNLHAAFNTATKDFSFAGETTFSVAGTDIAMTLAIDLRHAAGDYIKTFGGQITIGELVFDLRFVQNAASDVFVATYGHTGALRSIRVRDLVAYVSPDLASAIPESLAIDLKDVIFAFRKQGDVTSFLFGLDLGASINLAQLPLVGQVFAPDQTLAVDDLRILVASRALSGDDVAAFSALLPAGVAALPTFPAPADGATPPPALQQGLTLSAALRLGGTAVPLTLPIAADTAASATSSTTSGTDTALAVVDNTRWFTVQRAFGPVYFARVGVQYKDGAAWFLLDATLEAGGVSMTLEGLAVGSPLDHFAPVFSLRGLAIAYQSDALTIAGALLRVARTDAAGRPYDEYDGAALLKTNKLTLSALGSYAYLNGYPSLFVYATLDAPIGGPAFFFVTGLAAGFGYNRDLRRPTIDQVAQFPLVQAAAAGPRPSLGDSNQLMQELARIGQYLPPANGRYFFALGITFTSFKLIDSVALLTVSVGDEVAVEVLGLSAMIAPTPVAGEQAVSPVAEVRLAFKATFLPSQGFLGVQAQLTGDSYILSRGCRLTGGCAFYAWFAGEHAGDFVYTLGGYHPRFIPPPHYPSVPRLGINWQVNPQLSIKGQGYFALTSSALMAGGQLQITWESDNLKVWFSAGADFLVAWKPYYYDAAAYVQIRVDYTFHLFGTHHISVDVGADLRLWGPEFSGTAHVKLWIISFDVSFGHAARQPAPLDWPTFKASFLPYHKRAAGATPIPDNQIAACSIAAQEGLARAIPQDGAADLWVIDPLRFVLVAQSAIPSSRAHIKQELAFGQCYFDGADAQARPLPFRADSPAGPIAQATSDTSRHLGAVGVGPMDVAAGDLDSALSISITYGGVAVEHEFAYTPILKRAPAALWGGRLKPDLQAPGAVADTLAGFEIRPNNPALPGAGETLPVAWLQTDQIDVRGAYAWAQIADIQSQAGDDAARRASIRAQLADAATQAARAALLEALDVGADIDVGDDVADMFLVAPQVMSF